MKKICFILSLITAIMLICAGCGNEASAQTDNNGSAADEVSVVMPSDNGESPDYISPTVKNPDTASSSSNSTSKQAPYKSGTYYANKSSKKFHYPTCSSAGTIKSENLYITDNRSELINSGYEPCKRCNP